MGNRRFCRDSNAKLIAFGNPILDMSIVVNEDNLHKMFDLPLDGQLEVNEKQKALFKLVAENYDIAYSAGGCALNMSRVFSWICGQSYEVMFSGGIGTDAAAEKLTSIVEKDAVLFKFVKNAELPTAMCVAIVYGIERCLCADIGAAAVYTVKNLISLSLLTSIEKADLVYIEGYFITHSFETACEIAKLCKENNKTFVFNLCGDYVCKNHHLELSKLLPFVDMLFGYITEYEKLIECINLKKLSDSPEESSAVWDKLFVLSSYFKNKNLDFQESLFIKSEEETFNEYSKPLLLVTQGPDPVLCMKTKYIEKFSVPTIPKEDIVDTTGAGDSFVGGFLAAYCHNRSKKDCIECGIWSAAQILQQRGCTLPSYSASFLNASKVEC